jgi:hypothetical protein
MPTQEKLFVKLSHSDRVPAGFVFRYRVAAGASNGLLASRRPGRILFMMLLPPQTQRTQAPAAGWYCARRSGSMSTGRSIGETVPADCGADLRILQVITFSMRASALGPAPLTAPQDVERGLAWCVERRGGAMMIEASGRWIFP